MLVLMFEESLVNRLQASGVLAVLILESAEVAVPVARALLEGGVDCLELTLRTPVAVEAIRRIRAEVPEMLVGAGTVLTVQQVKEARAAGAGFGVAPGMNPRVVAAAREVGWSFAPGVCTPTDIELAVEQGCRVMKFFPAEPCGGLSYLRTIGAPFVHLGVKFIPLGGLSSDNAESYLREESVLALGGSWLAKRSDIDGGRWNEITRQANVARTLVKAARGN
jgi:2-dehydro-3-deoxyphosphogluconate aldolase / (4S)-4-hydroxy-2-oxoglutarate aldolase